MRLFLLILLVPLIEIGLFIRAGVLIGLWWTLAIVILTAIFGTTLLRSQWQTLMAQLQGSFLDLNDPTEPLAHGAVILLSGALLLTPGFVTDAVGFALLVPRIRSVLFRALVNRLVVQKFTYGSDRRPADPTVIDGEIEQFESTKGPTDRTQH